MSMIEKLAARVQEEGKQRRYDLIPCAACDYCGSSDCSMGKSCPALHTPGGSLMLARWAVKLVAEGLKGEVEALKERKAVIADMTNNSLRDAAGYGGCEYTPRQWKKAKAEHDVMAGELANGLLALITEAKEVSDGR